MLFSLALGLSSAVWLFAAPRPKTAPAAKPASGYSLTTVLQLVPPFNVADMNDEDQEARLLFQDARSALVEVTHHPLPGKRSPIQENRTWRRDDAGMSEYLRPTPSENWDEPMRQALLAELAKAGIDPDQLSDRELVTRVAAWAHRRGTHTPAFISFYVHFPGGVATVYPSLRGAFDQEKARASAQTKTELSDQAMFENEVLGRQMFYNRTYGSCTSYAVYQATILRALGIPTRMVVVIPPVDSNDAGQKQLLLDTLQHNRVRASLRHAMEKTAAPGGGTFSDHMFNEVYIGKHWVRLNYSTLGQEPLDEHYFGLMTHILTFRSLSELPLAQTWGLRLGRVAPEQAPLSSVNPYRLLAAREQLPADLANPQVADAHTALHVTDAYWADALPPTMAKRLKDAKTDFYLRVAEYIPNYRHQYLDFLEKNGGHLRLLSAQRPALRAAPSGITTYSRGSEGNFQMIGFQIQAEDRANLAREDSYTIQPVEDQPQYHWVVPADLTLTHPAPGVSVPNEGRRAVQHLMVLGLFRRDTLPLPELNASFAQHDSRSDCFVRVEAAQPGPFPDLHDFCQESKARFLLTAPGHPDLEASPSRSAAFRTSPEGEPWLVMGLMIVPESRARMVPGVSYRLQVSATVAIGTWAVRPDLNLTGWELGAKP